MIPIRLLQVRSLLSIVALFAFTLIGCGKGGEAAAEGGEPTVNASSAQTTAPGLVVMRSDAPELRQMTIAEVRNLPVPGEEVLAPAKIEANPNRIGHAVLPIPGRIVRVMVKLGDSVTQGQPLITIESLAIAEAESAYVQAETSVRQAELAAAKDAADLARLTDLFEHQAVAQKEVLAAQTTSALAKSAVDQAISAREQARRRLGLLGLKAGSFDQTATVKAPLAGKVLDVSVVEGEFRNEINTALITIADLSRVWATSEVPESKIRYCKVGGMTDLELIAFPGETFRARVTRIADTVNNETRTIKVSVELENPSGRLRPEMFGRLRYANEVVSTPWIPSSAVVRIGEKDFVFVEQAPGRFQSTAVELGRNHAEGYAVMGGLKAGTRIVTQGSVYLKAAL